MRCEPAFLRFFQVALAAEPDIMHAIDCFYSSLTMAIAQPPRLLSFGTMKAFCRRKIADMGMVFDA